MVGLIGIVLSLALLIVFAYRGVNVIILAPLMALLATVFAGGLPLLATYTQVFMPAALSLRMRSCHQRRRIREYVRSPP